jgi:hypothetical protein
MSFKPIDSIERFTVFAQLNGVKITDCYPIDGFVQALSFYQMARSVGCEGDDGDMLLYQWGTYDWGRGRNFELNITRQFVELEFEDDDAISQLSLTFKFLPTSEFEAIGSGNQWCDKIANHAQFEIFLKSHPAFLAVAKQKPQIIDLKHTYV